MLILDSAPYRETEARARFTKIREMVMDIYRGWNVSSREEVPCFLTHSLHLSDTHVAVGVRHR